MVNTADLHEVIITHSVDAVLIAHEAEMFALQELGSTPILQAG